MPDSKGKAYQVTIPDNVYQLVQLFDGIKPLAEVQAVYCDQYVCEPPQWQRLEALINTFLLTKKILINADSEAAFADEQPAKASHLQLQLPVFKARWVNPCAHALQFFYQKQFAGLMLILSLLAQLYFYWILQPDFVNLWLLDASQQIQILLITAAGLLFHELGHATAAFRFGCRKVDIGFGWYIVFLVFYAELSESWRLGRKQRAIIDSGGLYFQSIFTAILVFYYAQTGSAAVFYAIVLLNLSFLWNLNPFFRMDGYWLASDILGIANLRQSAATEFERLFAKYWQRSEKPLKHHMPTKTRQALLIYTLVSNAFFCWMVYYIGNRLLTTLTIDIQTKWQHLQSEAIRQSGWLELTTFAAGMLIELMMIVFFSVFLYRTAKRAWHLTQRLKSS